MRVEPYRHYHLELVRAQGVQRAQLTEVSLVPDAYARFVEPAGPCYTAFVGDRVILCGGIVVSMGYMGIAWAVIAEDAGRHMIRLHRCVERFLSMQNLRRIETTVVKGFQPGCRWAESLGFKFEGEMPGFGLDGQTHLRYGRVR